VKEIAEVIEPLKVELAPHAAMPSIFDQSRKIAGHPCDEAIQFAGRLLGAPRSLHRLIMLSHEAVNEQLDVLDQVTGWRRRVGVLV